MIAAQIVIGVALALNPLAQQLAAAQDVPALIRQLQAQDPWAREAAKVALIGLTDPAAVQPLLVALEAPGTDRKAIPVILDALRKFNDPRKIPALISHARSDGSLRDAIAGQLFALGEPAVRALAGEISSCQTIAEWDVFRAWAAGTLGTMGEAGVDVLLDLSRDGVACRRAYAVSGMENATDDARAALAIKTAVDDADWWVRSTTFRVLNGLLDPERAPRTDPDFAALVVPLTDRLRGDADTALRTDLIEILEKIGDARAVPAIRAMQKDKDETVREAAARALKTLAPPRNLPDSILPQLRSADPAVRIAGVNALAELDTNQTPRIIPLLKDRDARVRTAAAEALGDLNEFGHDPNEENDQDLTSVRPLVAALEDVAPEVRAAAATALGLIEDEQAVNPLAARLRDTDQRVVRTSILALKTIGSVNAGPALAALYPATDQATRVLVLSALWQLCDPRTTPVLVEGLADPVLRDAAGSALGCVLGRQRDARAVDALLAALAVAGNPSSAFLEAVAATRDPRAVPQLARLAVEGSEVRSWALSALGNLGDAAAAPILSAGLRDRDPATRLSAAAALAKLENFRVTNEMIDALVDEDAGVRGSAARALARSHDPRAIPPLVRAMDATPAAIAALGDSKSPEAVDGLVRYMLDEKNDLGNRVEAARSLGELGDARAVAPLLSVLNEPSGLLAAAASALGALGDRRALEPLRAIEQRLGASPSPGNLWVLGRVRDAIAKIERGRTPRV